MKKIRYMPRRKPSKPRKAKVIIIPNLVKPPVNPNWKEEAMKIKYKPHAFNGCSKEQLKLCLAGGGERCAYWAKEYCETMYPRHRRADFNLETDGRDYWFYKD